MPTILLKGNATNAAQPLPGGLLPREPIWAEGGFTNLPAHAEVDVRGQELAIYDGARTVPLVSYRRQVELIGAQRITGLKTFDLLSISILGGTTGQVLTTDGSGGLSWGAGAGAGGPTYTFRRGLSEDLNNNVDLNFAGNAAAELGGIFVPNGLGLNLTTAPGATQGQLALAPATANVIGGVFVPGNAGLNLTPGTGQLALAPATVGPTLGGVFVPVGGGLILTTAPAANAGQLALAPATVSVIGGVFVPANIGLDLTAAGQLTLGLATQTVRGGITVPPGTPPNGGLAISGGQLTLLPATNAVIGGVFVQPELTSGLILSGAGQLSLPIATATQRGGVTVPANGTGGLQVNGAGAVSVFPATQGDATAGTDNARPITPLVLQLGPDPRTLPTTAKTLVGAITEIHGLLGSISGALKIVGTFDADQDYVTPITGSPFQPGELPAAQASYVGYFLIVDTAGEPSGGNAPQVPMVPGDIVICVEDAGFAGQYHWGHLGIGQAQIAALNVTIGAIAGLNATNVQVALEQLQLNKAERPLLIDSVSLSGDGQTTELAVDIVDGGTF